MEIWRVGYDTAQRPKVISKRNLAIALGLHVSAFVLFWLYAACHDLFRKEEEIIPIDLTVVVNQNLDGKENEPPPLKKVEPEPPKPKPKPQTKPKVKEEKPKELEKIVTNIVTKVDKKVEEKKPEKKKPEKSAKELREEKMAKMRASAKQVNQKVTIEVKNRPSGDGITAKRPKDWEKLFNDGYKPGAVNQIASSENQRCLSLIRETFHSKWTPPPWTDTLKKMYLRIQLGAEGRVIGYELVQSSTDRNADQTVLSAASRVKVVHGLSVEFLRQNKTVRIDFEVKPQ